MLRNEEPLDQAQSFSPLGCKLIYLTKVDWNITPFNYICVGQLGEPWKPKQD